MDPEPDDECAVDRAKRRADRDGSWSCENRRYFVIAHQYHRDVGSETEHRADREVEVAADHQEGHTDADDAELRCDRHHVDEGFLGGKEVGLASAQVAIFVNTLLASLLPAGSISFLYYADRIMEFPLGVFGVALASAALPAMSRAAAAGDTREVGTTLTFALGLSFYVTVPATVGLVLLRTPIVRVLKTPDGRAMTPCELDLRHDDVTIRGLVVRAAR